MSVFDPFRRAAMITLAWWLVGFGIDLGSESRAQKAPTSNSGQFAIEHQQSSSLKRPN